jgi:hypothetical protein
MPALTDTSIDDAWAGDPLLARLRAARPETPAPLLDPRAPAARELVDAITTTPGRAGRSRAPRRLAVMAVAAAVVVAAVVVGRPGPSGPPPAAAIVREAAAASQEAFTTGRATITSPNDMLPFGDQITYTFAGDDLAAVLEGDLGGTRFVAERRQVDGELYWNPGATGRPVWFHDVAADSVAVHEFVFDPRGLLAVLEPAAGFEVVGDEVLDGVPVTRLRATTPGAVDASVLALGEAAPPVSSVEELEVWVDQDRVLRRIDLTTASDPGSEIVDGRGPVEMDPVVTEASVRFADLGEPLTVEAPATYEDVDLAQALSTGP